LLAERRSCVAAARRQRSRGVGVRSSRQPRTEAVCKRDFHYHHRVLSLRVLLSLVCIVSLVFTLRYSHSVTTIAVQHKDLSGCDVSALGLVDLADALRVNRTLTSLYLNDCAKIGDEGVSALALVLRDQNGSLRRLSVAGCNVGDDAVVRLADALTSDDCRLEWLDLQRNRITCVGATALAAALRDNRVVRTLILRFNNVADNGAIAIGVALRTADSVLEEVERISFIQIYNC
jgi:Ran GTPase-activating protein (RanGAP) involved in mRNA processing and transport